MRRSRIEASRLLAGLATKRDLVRVSPKGRNAKAQIQRFDVTVHDDQPANMRTGIPTTPTSARNNAPAS
jgi:hypothetical protein